MRRSLLLSAFLAALAAHGQFGPPQVILQGAVTDPQRADTIDIDHDGDLDLLIFCMRENRAMLARNQGSGTFDEPEEMLHTSWDIGVAALADMNSDGERDVLLGSDEYEGGISLFLSTGAAFGPEQVVLSESHYSIYAIHATDVDGDGNMDILAKDDDGVFWLAGDGSGFFGARVGLVSPLYSITRITVSDLDQDGLEDLIHVDYSDVGWYRNLGGGVMQDMGGVPGFSGDEPPVCGDLDNDGDNDVVVLGSHEIASFLLDETMTLVPDTVLDGFDYDCTGALLTDLNGDELPELVLGGYHGNHLMLLPNLGGAFGTSTTVENEAGFVNFLTAGDLDGNGTVDVIHARTSNSMADVRWNSGDGAGNLGPTTPILGSGPPYPWDAATADVDLDGDKDIVVISWYYSPAPATTEVYLFENLGAGHFDQGQLLFSGVFEHYQGKYLELQDLNADGYEDIVLATNPGASVLLNDGAGGFVLAATLTALGVLDITVSDINGDASPDVVIANDTGLEWWTNDGLGSFGLPQLIDASADTCDYVLSGDVDGDADMDLLAVTDNHLQIILFRNNGGGAFDPGVVLFEDTIMFPNPMSLADLDGDGDLDLAFLSRAVLYAETYKSILWLLNDGTGSFSGPVPGAGAGIGWSDWTLADVDQDDKVDMVYGARYLLWGNGPLYWKRNTGTGQFGAAQLFAEDQTGSGPMEATDLDGDGDTDVIVTFPSHARLTWYENHAESPYRIEGTVFMDADLNGAYGDADTPFPYAPVSITPMLSNVMTGTSGSYTAFVDTGSFVLESVLPDPLWTLTTVPPVQSVQVNTLTPQITGIDFGWAPAIDTSIVLPGFLLGSAPCGGTANAWLSYANRGTRIEQGTVTLELDPLFTFVNSTTPPSLIVGNTLTWDFDSLGWFESGHIAMEVELPPVGSAWTNTTTATTVDSLGNTTGVFTSAQSGDIGCAYDPNDKQVEPQGYGIHGAVPIDTEWLTYTIRFQNTGTDTAYNVIIVDQLDADLDRSSLQVLGTSHGMTSMQIDDAGEMTFRFNNIMLPDSNVNLTASQGYLRYRIRPVDDAPDGTFITNTASIIFDFNPAIITNTVSNRLVDCELFAAQIHWQTIDALMANAGDHFQWYFEGDSIDSANSRWLFVTEPGNYTVEVTNVYGCVDLSDPYQVIITGIGMDERTGMMVAPNPTTGHVTLTVANATSGHVMVHDARGTVVQRTAWPTGSRSMQLDLEALENGIYLVELITPEGRSTARVVQMH